jgi:hypothetical protein
MPEASGKTATTPMPMTSGKNAAWHYDYHLTHSFPCKMKMCKYLRRSLVSESLFCGNLSCQGSHGDT